jgi:hypothetical protein
LLKKSKTMRTIWVVGKAPKKGLARERPRVC